MGQKQTKQRQPEGKSTMERSRQTSTSSSTTQMSVKQTITTSERVIINGEVVKDVVTTNEASGTHNSGIDFSNFEKLKAQLPRPVMPISNTPQYKSLFDRKLSGDGIPINRSSIKPLPSSSISNWTTSNPTTTSTIAPRKPVIQKTFTPSKTFTPTAVPLSSPKPYTYSHTPTTTLAKITSKPITPVVTGSTPVQKPINPAPSEENAAVEELVIKVRKTKTLHDGNLPNITYSTHGKNRGSMILINNIQFEKKSMFRHGAEVDEKNIKKLFTQMGFKIESRTNLKADKMKDALRLYSKSSKLKMVDINIVVLMSHGYGNKTGTTVIAGTDDKELHMAEIVELFNNQNCPYLIGKPKIFIFQCCRGEAFQQRIQTDTVPFQYRNEVSDILLAFSTIPGYVSYRDECFGTLYIRAICEVFMEFACDNHVEDLLKMVQNKLNQMTDTSNYGQTSSYENMGFNRCYLHP